MSDIFSHSLKYYLDVYELQILFYIVRAKGENSIEEGFLAMIPDAKGFKSRKNQGLMPLFLLCMSALIIIGSITIIGALAQNDQKKTWIWSVGTSGPDGELDPFFYLPSDKMTVNWTITLSEEARIKDAKLWIYKDGTSMYKDSPYPIPPNELNYKDGKYNNRTSISLLKYSDANSKENRTYNVAIEAFAETNSKKVNETHIIEVKIQESGTLKITKRVSGIKNPDASLISGWVFLAEGPKDTQAKSHRYSATTDDKGTAAFPNLRAGIYDITETPRSGWLKILPMSDVEIKRGDLTSLEVLNTPNKLIITKVDSEGNIISNPKFRFMIKGLDGEAKDQGFSETLITDDSGNATKTNLPSGKYSIEEVPQPGWRLINLKNMKDGSKSNKELIVDFGSGQEIYVQSTNAKTGTIKIIKADTEGHPLKGWTFSIKGEKFGDGLGQTNPTNEAGIVLIPNLLPDTYTIQEIDEDGWKCISDNPQTPVVLNPDGTVEVRFVNARLKDLIIKKFEDKNGNRVQDEDEIASLRDPRLANWHFTVQGPDGQTRGADTDDSGTAVVRGLIPGKYVVTEDTSEASHPGWICTTQNPMPVTITSTSEDVVKFGNKVDKIIFFKFNDTNLNGKHDEEEGLPNWEYNVVGPDGSLKPIPKTNSSGFYILEGTKPGNYLITEVRQNGWINTTPLSKSISINAGEEVKVSYGNINAGKIVLFKFNDTNRNRFFDSGESPLAGWTFNVTGPNGYATTTEPTNEDGVTTLNGLIPGDYIVTENLIEGWLVTTPRVTNIRLYFGDSRRVEFGNYYCLRCHRITENKTPNSTDGDVTVIKEVSNLSTENVDRENGNVVDYNITICPSRSIGEIAAIPTDIVIAVDNSPSISNLRDTAVDGVHKLAQDIAANDKNHVTRIGLVSWSDEENSGIEVPLIDNYTEVAARASKIKFAEGNFTKYEIGLSKSMQAVGEAGIIGGKEKKIVIITDANDSGYARPNLADMDLSGYSIFAIVVGDNKETNASVMLNDLTRKHKGYVIPIKDLSELGEALVKTATAGSLIKNVHLVEVLPNYLALLNSTATDDEGRIRLNGDSKDWTTTTITWDIGDLSGCWNTDFQAVFCWKLPADVNQPKLNSYVNYTDEMGMSRTLLLPEHEINIVTGTGNMPVTASKSAAEPKKEAPGFEALFAAIGISLAGYLYRRRMH